MLTLSHFNAALVFSVCASTVFAITQRTNQRDMFRYGLMSRPWIVDSLPPVAVKSGPTMDEVWERSDQYQLTSMDAL